MAFDSAMKSSSNRVMLAVTPSEFSLILPQSLPVIARFTDSLPQDLLPGQLSDSIGKRSGCFIYIVFKVVFIITNFMQCDKNGPNLFKRWRTSDYDQQLY